MYNFSNHYNSHSFVICAYKDNCFLEKCILSILKQNKKSNIIIATSTPNNHIHKLAEKYKIKVCINKNHLSLQDDWNYAINCANSNFVTLCHQDDIYKPNYFLEISKVINSTYANKIAYIHTGYYDMDEFDNEKSLKNNRIKRFLLFTSRFKFFQSTKFGKKFYLRFGSTITGPSITYNKSALGKNFFNSKFLYNSDWDFFYKIAKTNYRVVYLPKRLISKRITPLQQTTSDILNGLRAKEDLEMLKMFWGKHFSKIIFHFYKKAYKIYKF